MSFLKTGGRILFAVPFLFLGVVQLINAAQMASIVPMVPGPGSQLMVVVITGVVLVLAGASLAIGKFPHQATMILGIFLLFTSLTIHFPQMINAEKEAAKMMSLSNMLKDLALAGAAFFISGTYKKSTK